MADGGVIFGESDADRIIAAVRWVEGMRGFRQRQTLPGRPGATAEPILVRCTSATPDGDGLYPGVVTYHDGSAWADAEVACKLRMADGSTPVSGTRYACRPTGHASGTLTYVHDGPASIGFTDQTHIGIISLADQWIGDGIKKFQDPVEVHGATDGSYIEFGNTYSGLHTYSVHTLYQGAAAVNQLIHGHSGSTASLQLFPTGTSYGMTVLSGPVSSLEVKAPTAHVIAQVNSGSGYLAMQADAANCRMAIVPVAGGAVRYGADGTSGGGDTVTGGIITALGSGSPPSDGDKGDITVSSSGTVWTIDANAVTTSKILNANVTLAKIANAAANSRLVGSGSAGSGAAYSEISLGAGLAMSGTTLSATLASPLTTKGDLWGFSTVDARIPVGTNDYVLTADSTQTLGLKWAANAAGVPAGTIAAYGAATAPTGYLLCDGAAVSRTTYASLFSAIGTTYGAGDGSTTFNVPDGKGRALVGAGTGSGLTARTCGQTGGAETVTLSSTESGIAAHTHAITPAAFTNAGGVGTAAAPGAVALGTIAVTQSSGGSSAAAAHTNMQPWWCASWVIKT